MYVCNFQLKLISTMGSRASRSIPIAESVVLCACALNVLGVIGRTRKLTTVIHNDRNHADSGTRRLEKLTHEARLLEASTGAQDK